MTAITIDPHARLAEFLKLEPDWDSYGGLPTDPAIVARAERFLQAAEAIGLPLPFPVPTSDGGVSLEWHNVDTEIALRIAPDEPVSLWWDGEE